MTEVKVILLGESAVGKTSILFRLLDGRFKERYNLTFVDSYEHKIYIEGKEITLCIIDTNGQERFPAIMKNYYRNVDGALLVYDVTDYATFYGVPTWMSNVKEVNETAEFLIAGNKNEDPEKKNVTVCSMAENFARDEDLEHIEMSAKSGENVEMAFCYLTKKILKAKKN